MQVPLADPPTAPSALRVTDRSKGRIAVAWEPVAPADGEHLTSYVIQQRKVSENVYQTVATVDASASSCALDKLVIVCCMITEQFVE